VADIECPCGEIHRYTAVALGALLNAALRGELHTVGTETASDGRRVAVVHGRCTDDVIPATRNVGGRPRKALSRAKTDWPNHV